MEDRLRMAFGMAEVLTMDIIDKIGRRSQYSLLLRYGFRCELRHTEIEMSNEESAGWVAWAFLVGFNSPTLAEAESKLENFASQALVATVAYGRFMRFACGELVEPAQKRLDSILAEIEKHRPS